MEWSERSLADSDLKSLDGERRTHSGHVTAAERSASGRQADTAGNKGVHMKLPQRRSKT